MNTNADLDAIRDEHMGVPRKSSRRVVPPRKLEDYVWRGGDHVIRN